AHGGASPLDADAPLRRGDRVEARARLGRLARHDRLERLAARAARVDLREERLVPLGRARRLADLVVRAREIERDAVSLLRADVAVDRLPRRERAAVVAALVLLHPEPEPLTVRGHR